MARYGQREALADPLTALSMEDPQPVYADYLRDRSVWRSDDRVYLFRMDDILAVNRSPAFTGNGDSGPLLGRNVRLPPLDIDGEVHLRYRKLLDPLFALKSKSSRIAGLVPVVEQLARDLIIRLKGRTELDAFTDFCELLPTQVFLTLLGLPVADLSYFLDFKQGIIRPSGATIEERERCADDAAAAMFAYLNADIDERERIVDTRDDLVNGLRTAEVDGQTLTRDEILNVIYLLVIAGLDTVTASLSCMLVWLARHPLEQQRLRTDPTVTPKAVEELMRFHTPVQWGHRYATTDVVLPSGAAVKAGEYVQAIWSAANLDEDAFDNPLIVNFDRPANRHIAFASGIHRCLGSHLARLELRVALDEWHRQTDSYSIVEGDAPEFSNFIVRTAGRIPLAVEWSD